MTELGSRTSRLPLRENLVGQGLLLVTLVLLAVGVVMVPSALASVGSPSPWHARASVRHVLFAALAAVVLLTVWRVDYRRLLGRRRWPWIPTAALIVAVICGLLVFVPGVGRSVGGYRRWIRIGPPQYGIGFQPSELIKLSLVIFLAAWLTRQGQAVRSFRKSFLPAVGVLGVCVAVVVTQDLGTAVVIAVAACVAMLLAGVQWYYLAGLAACGAGGFYALLAASPAKWRRIEAMLDPFAADNPCAYQLRQSLTTIVTGGWTGKGLGLGMMKRGFLPEDSTDFLFAILCEEWGLIAGVALMAILVAWLVLANRVAARAGDPFGCVLAGSLGFLIALQAAMHVAVNVGWLPPTGVAMPLLSAGGTSIVLMAAATALIVSVSSRRADNVTVPGAAVPGIVAGNP